MRITSTLMTAPLPKAIGKVAVAKDVLLPIDTL
jgi:hypothetical protein